MKKPDLNWTVRFGRRIWEKDLAKLGPVKGILIRLARIIYGVIRKFADGQLNLWATSLVYTTLLSLVPLIAVSFSVLKAFGLRNRLEPILLEFLAPLGQQGLEIKTKILDFVNNVNGGVLGAVGIAFLFYTVVSLMQTIEQAFNGIWHVPETRSMARRFSDYLSVILIGPVLILAALGLASSAMDSAVVQWLTSIEPLGTLILIIGQVVPYFLISAAFAFLYGFIPNTHVRARAALIGGLFSGVLWYATGVLFTNFVVTSSSYSAIYSSFAGAILFIYWLYIGWLIILVGAQVAFYWQNPRYLNPLSENAVVNSRQREELALEMMTLIGRAHYYNESLWTLEALKTQIQHVNPDALEQLLETLVKEKLVVASADDPPAYLPARDIETINLKEVITVARGKHPYDMNLFMVKEVMDKIDAAMTETLKNRTLKELVLSGQHDQADEACSGQPS